MLKSIFQYIFIFVFLIIFNNISLAQENFPLVISTPPGYSENFKSQIEKTYQNIAKNMLDLSGFPLQKKAYIILCKNYEEMKNIAQDSIPEWALGIAMPHRYIIAIDLSKVDFVSNNLHAVVRHEACHLYLGAWEDAYKKTIPLWLNEGIAQWVSGALHLTYQEEILDSVVYRKIIPFSSLKFSFPKNSQKARQAYLQSRSMVGYILETYGKKSIKDILSYYAVCDSFEEAVEKTLGINFLTLETEWKTVLKPEPWWGWIWQLRHLFSLFTFMAFLVLIAYWRQRQKSKKILIEWIQEEKRQELEKIQFTIVREQENEFL